MATTLAPSTMDLKDFFSAAEGRIEQWRQLHVTARGWEADVAHGRGAERGHADAARLLDVIGTIVNTNVQVVVIYDGFPFRSRHDLPVLHEFLLRHLRVDPGDVAPGALATTLARGIKSYRPELDLYLLTDRAVEQLASTADAAPFRRIFHHVEEVMEVHLSILDGVGDRYDTPYFGNLKRYAQRPMGTFHALPVARGKSVFRSNWIRDMAQFYGVNLFLAESSATTGGLDSLLEPTGNIKKAQDLAARAFGAQRAYFGTNGTSTSNKIVVQAVCRPGDIVIVDRNSHKAHHYGFELARAQPYYVEAFPLTQYSMYGAVPLRTIKKALLDCKTEGNLDRVRRSEEHTSELQSRENLV